MKDDRQDRSIFTLNHKYGKPFNMKYMKQDHLEKINNLYFLEKQSQRQILPYFSLQEYANKN